MTVIFFIKSSSVDISNYNIKDLTGSTGRLDVIVRCVLAALLNDEGFENDVQIWVFLDKYGTYIFNTALLDYETLPKNELMLADYFVSLIKKENSSLYRNGNPLASVQILKTNILDTFTQFRELEYSVYVLKENGESFFNYIPELLMMQNILFVVGSQIGDFINSEELLSMNFPNMSLGTQSYLASSVIRLIKLYLLKFI